MSENPLRTNVLRPVRLTMRECVCFYCGSQEYDDFTIEHLYGIRHCPDHKAWAERDCRAMCHDLKKIPMWWLKGDIRFQTLFSALTSNIHVRRSSGTIDSDWCLARGTYFDPRFLTKTDKGWAIPMMNPQKIGKIILLDELRELNPEINPAVFATAISLLDSGLYKDQYDEHIRLTLMGESTAIPEDSRIQTIVRNGQEVRVFHG